MILTPGGWANVYRGSQMLGTTPKQVELPPGRQTLTLVPFGDRAKTRRVRVVVEPGRLGRIVERLD
jgi:hypothetical protein